MEMCVIQSQRTDDALRAFSTDRFGRFLWARQNRIGPDRNGSRWKLQASGREETACWLHSREHLLLQFLPEREWPDEQNYLSGLWRDCDFTACVCRSISVVKNFFRAEVL